MLAHSISSWLFGLVWQLIFEALLVCVLNGANLAQFEQPAWWLLLNGPKI